MCGAGIGNWCRKHRAGFVTHSGVGTVRSLLIPPSCVSLWLVPIFVGHQTREVGVDGRSTGGLQSVSFSRFTSALWDRGRGILDPRPLIALFGGFRVGCVRPLALRQLREAAPLCDQLLTGPVLSEQTVCLPFKRFTEEIGAPEARFHDLRHSYAVAVLRSGADIKSVQGNLGHATVSFALVL